MAMGHGLEAAKSAMVPLGGVAPGGEMATMMMGLGVYGGDDHRHHPRPEARP